MLNHVYATDSRYNQPTTAGTAQVLSSYAAAVHGRSVPYPQPVYQESEAVEPPQSSSAVSATDFQLLRLAADDLDVQHTDVGLAELLRPAGRCCPPTSSPQATCLCMPGLRK